jgi:hypothetical protein
MSRIAHPHITKPTLPSQTTNLENGNFENKTWAGDVEHLA